MTKDEDKYEDKYEDEEYVIKVGQATYCFGKPCPTLSKIIFFEKKEGEQDDSAQPTRRQ